MDLSLDPLNPPRRRRIRPRGRAIGHSLAAPERARGRFLPSWLAPSPQANRFPRTRPIASPTIEDALLAWGASLFAWTADAGWAAVAELDSDGAGDISRLAVSPDGSHIAIVRNR